MASIDLRRLSITFVWDKDLTGGNIEYEGHVTGFVPDTTRSSGEADVPLMIKGTLTPTQFDDLTSASMKTTATTALEVAGGGSHTVADDTGT